MKLEMIFTAASNSVIPSSSSSLKLFRYVNIKRTAEAAARATDRSDYFRYDADGNFTLHGVKFITLDVLNDPVNSYGEVIILCDPDAIAYGPVEDITSEGEYSIVKKSYITSFDVFFDIALLFPQDVLYADVVAIESSPSNGGD